MGRLNASLLALVLAAVAALGLVACGGGGADLLPGGTASEIESNLDQVQALVGEGDCVGAEDAAQAVSGQIEELGGVDKELKQALREGATRLNEVVVECVEAPAEETEPAIESAEEPEEFEKKEKPAKPEKPKQEAEEAPAEETDPSLPPQAEGKAKGHEEEAAEEVPPAETEAGGTSAGGVGPGTPAGGE
jgi:outer membrane biosynthesis protein TonB